jgi:hypothetical protein
MKKVKFKVEGLRKIPNPYGAFLEDSKKKSPEMYTVICNVMDMPKELPTKTNPREQNMRTKVAARIKEGLLSENSPFFLLNRGMLISVKDVKFDNVNSEIVLWLEDDSVHGVVDGGHTYRTIMEYRDLLSKEQKQFVRIELLTGIEDIFEDVAAARNTSVQVQDKAIAELKQKFEIIKQSIVSEPFSDDIAYRENEEKNIDVSDILTLLYMFNLERHKDREKMAVSAYSSKQACIKEYTKTYDKYEENGRTEENPYYKMRPVMSDFFKLYELVETSMARKYKEAHNGGKYGSVKGVDVPKSESKFESKFYHSPMDHRTPRGFLYPIVGAFRAILEEKDGVYAWKADPFEFFEEIGKNLVSETIERSRTLGNNPNAVGKDAGHWKQLYNNVLTNFLLKQLN